ncbi:hypothetical protein PHAVU_005G175900 [Phaseolus vulgaris]|uniref:peptide deformylase 1A, chloroplastic/mitochondrial-like isoform X3 n=1 Tax=Phaseolus vulgaris TaxID=3885 RepID=UPI0035CB3F83
MEAVQLVALRLRVVPVAAYLLRNGVVMHGCLRSSSSTTTTTTSTNGMAGKRMSSGSGWLMDGAWKLPKIVKAGEPVLHERAKEVEASEMKSERVQKIIDDMIRVMRKAPGVGLAAPQIGISLRVSILSNIIVLEDKEEYMGYDDEEALKEQDRRPFHLMVILNPKLKKKTNSVVGYAVVERHLDVEVEGFDRYGKPIKINATGWQARILQHECDHLDGTLYVDKMVPRTFRAPENSSKPLARGCPKLGPR